MSNNLYETHVRFDKKYRATLMLNGVEIAKFFSPLEADAVAMVMNRHSKKADNKKEKQSE